MNENATMHLKVEKVSMPGLSGKRIDHVIINEHVLEVNQTTMCTNFTVFCPEWSDYYDDGNWTCSKSVFENEDIQLDYIGITLTRDVSKTDVEHTKLDVMPGFKISWEIQNENPPMELETEKLGHVIETPNFKEPYQPDFLKNDHIYEATLKVPESLSDQIGNGSLVIEVEVDLIEDEGFSEEVQMSRNRG